MANRPSGYGLTAQCTMKLNAKYSESDEEEIVHWIKDCTKMQGPEEAGRLGFRNWLLDGQVLCALANSFGFPEAKCKPNKPGGINKGMRRAKENENIGMFLDAMEGLGVKKIDLFQTVDIRDNQNMVQVQNTLFKVGSVLQSKNWNGPTIGIKSATENHRNFDEDTQRAGRNVIGLQMGTNQVASQKGMTPYGIGRQIAGDY